MEGPSLWFLSAAKAKPNSNPQVAPCFHALLVVDKGIRTFKPTDHTFVIKLDVIKCTLFSKVSDELEGFYKVIMNLGDKSRRHVQMLK